MNRRRKLTPAQIKALEYAASVEEVVTGPGTGRASTAYNPLTGPGLLRETTDYDKYTGFRTFKITAAGQTWLNEYHRAKE